MKTLGIVGIVLGVILAALGAWACEKLETGELVAPSEERLHAANLAATITVVGFFLAGLGIHLI